MPISTINSNSLSQASDLTINGQTVGKGGGNVSTNTAHGVSALQANTTGSNATVVGYQAGYTTTVGLRQSFFGSQAGYYMTDENTSVGYRALYGASGSTGYYNVAVGRYALNVLTSGTSNVAIGDNALQANTTGIENTAVGYQALNANLTASYNTSVGRNSLYLTTTGTHNTCIGHNSGYNISTGTKNTILGRYDGNQGSLDIRTASNYIVLSDGDGNPRQYWTGDGTSYMGFTSTGAIESYISSSCGRANYYNAAGATRGCQYYYYSAVEKGSISITSTGVTYNTVSDYRLKENIAPMTGALAKVAQLKPVTYKWKEDGSDGQGFIAHELKEVVSDCVSGEKDAVDEDGKPVYQGIDTSYLVATLTAAIQELKTIVDAQAAEIAELKGKVNT